MQEQIDLVVVAEEPKKTGGMSLGLLASVILHTGFIIWFLLFAPRHAAPVQQSAPMVRYVELIKQNPQTRDFTEAPGPETGKAPIAAPFSDKNRQASIPEPTGLTPTNRPGDGRGAYTPQLPPPGTRGAQPQAPQIARQPQQPSSGASALATTNPASQPAPEDTFVYREPAKASAAAVGAIDWRSAIKSVKAPIGSGGAQGLDFGDAGGGELGTADQGPLSFETSWYDWGPYAQSMVSRIRVNWYANMPSLIRTGIKGVVTIRFTIERDGRITDITILKSSGHPPYDFAAKKAIELSSPLNPLPKDFPNSSERVTAMFYYNTPLP